MTEPSSSALAGWAIEPFTNAGITHDLYTRGVRPRGRAAAGAPGHDARGDGAGRPPGRRRVHRHRHLAGRRPRSAAVPGVRGPELRLGLRLPGVRAPSPSGPTGRSRSTCGRSPAGCTTGWAGRVSASSGCASPAASPWPRRSEKSVLAPVASQPGSPFPLTASRRADIGMSDRERDRDPHAGADRGPVPDGAAVQRGQGLAHRPVPVAARRLRGRLAARVDQLPARHPAGIGTNEHSVLTSKDVETPGHPTHEARDQVTAFLRQRLGVTTAADA